MPMRTDTEAVSKPLEKLTATIEDTAHAAGEKARATIEQGREVLKHGREAASDFAERAGTGTAAFVRERPLSALAIALGVGVVGALLLGRRHR